MTMGFQAINITDGVRAWANCSPLVKAIDDVNILKLASPTSILVFRVFIPDQSSWFDRPQEFVAMIDKSLNGFRAPGRLYVETLNEIGKGDAARYIKFLETAVPLLHGLGLLVAGPSWGTGDYEQLDWDLFRAAKWCGLNAIALHAYWAGSGFTEWNALRWRTYYDEKLDLGLPIFVTECGRDKVRDGINGTMIGAGGWKADQLTVITFANELIAYFNQRRANEHYFIFVAGATPDWDNYDIELLIQLLIKSLKGNVNIVIKQLDPALEADIRLHLDILWGYTSAATLVKNPALSEKACHERIVALKKDLGLN